MIAAGNTSKIGDVSKVPHSGSAVESTPEGWLPFRMAENDRLNEVIIYNRLPSRQMTGSERAFERWRIRFARYAPQLFGFVPANQRKPAAYNAFETVTSAGGAQVHSKIDADRDKIVVAGGLYDVASFMDVLFGTKHRSFGYRVASIRAAKNSSNITDDSFPRPTAAGEITAHAVYNSTTKAHELTLTAAGIYSDSILDSLIGQLSSAIESFRKLREYKIEELVGVYSNPVAKLREVLDWVHSNDAKDIKALLNEKTALRSIGIEESGRDNYVSVGLRLNSEGRIRAVTIRIIENIMNEMRDEAGTFTGFERQVLNQSFWIGHLIDRGRGVPEILWEVGDSDLQGKVQSEHTLLLINQIRRLFVRNVHQTFLWEGYEHGEAPSGASPTATPSATPASAGNGDAPGTRSSRYYEFPGSQFMSAEGADSSLNALRAGIDKTGLLPGPNGREFHRVSSDTPPEERVRAAQSFSKLVEIEISGLKTILEQATAEDRRLLREPFIRNDSSWPERDPTHNARVYANQRRIDSALEGFQDVVGKAEEYSDVLGQARVDQIGGFVEKVLKETGFQELASEVIRSGSASGTSPAPSTAPVPNLQPGMMGISATQIGPQTVLYNPALAMMNLPLTNIVPMMTGV